MQQIFGMLLKYVVSVDVAEYSNCMSILLWKAENSYRSIA